MLRQRFGYRTMLFLACAQRSFHSLALADMVAPARDQKDSKSEERLSSRIRELENRCVVDIRNSHDTGNAVAFDQELQNLLRGQGEFGKIPSTP